MPKVKKEKVGKASRHNPLAEQIIEEEGSQGLRKTPRVKQRKGAAADGEEAEEPLPPGVTRKVLEVAQAQKAEDDRDAPRNGGGSSCGGGGRVLADRDLDDLEGDDPVGEAASGGEDEEVCDIEVDEEGYIVTEGASEEDERALALFLPPGGATAAQKAGPTLADVILQKIHEHDARQAGADAKDAAAAGEGGEAAGLSPKVLEVYGEIGKWLKHYKSGKMPKAFKVIPSLVNWEEVLALTNPLNWSPAAMYEAVNIFASNLNPRMAQRFYNLVLLPAVRQNIAQYQKLNFHYYRAMRKALFKPAAFFKGVALPLATESCTLREATILSSVLAKASIPVMHVAAALVRLCMMTPWYGTTSVLIATLVNKKYALPVRVIESLVAHFAAFGREDAALPVVFHRALLLFVQRYKFDLGADQKRRLRELLRVHFHESIGPEVRRELQAVKPGEEPAETAMEVG